MDNPILPQGQTFKVTGQQMDNREKRDLDNHITGGGAPGVYAGDTGENDQQSDESAEADETNLDSDDDESNEDDEEYDDLDDDDDYGSDLTEDDDE